VQEEKEEALGRRGEEEVQEEEEMTRGRVIGLGLAAAALLAVPAQAGAITLHRGDFPAGTNPTSVAVGNFNGGAQDLAVANEGSDNVSILLGNGLGQFTAGPTVTVGDAPSSVVVGSFNGDAFADLGIASVGNDNIAIRLGDGSGGFTGTGTVSTGTNSDPRSLATGDFNGDTKTDLVSANSGSSTVTIQLGDGMGGFAVDATPESVAASAAGPVSVAAGRFENPPPPGTPDPDLDAIIASPPSDQVLLLTGDGIGGFNGSATQYVPTFSAMNPDPSGIAVGALNPSSPNPGFAAEPDILVANQGLENVMPGFGRIDGTSFDFGAGSPTGAGSDPVGVAFGDLDGDGDPDGISANRGADTATVILSDGLGGTSADTTSQVGASPRAVATGGFDADGKADAVTANYLSGSVSVLTSLPPGPQAVKGPPPAPTKTKCKKKKKKHSAAAAKKKCKKKKKK
jgi:hypothetical protein